MSTLGSPSDLFTAGEQAPSTSADPIGSTPGSSGIVHATHTISLKDASFYVEVPKLSPESLRKYESANIHDSEALSWGETPAKPLYVRGELHLYGQVWLFVKYDDGLFRKFSPSEIKKKLPQLAAKYATRKIRKRHLITTDPNYYVIHPDFNNGPNSLYFTYNTDDDDETSEYVHVKRRSREGSSSSRSESQFEETDEESDYQPRRSSRAAKKISYATHDDSDFGEEEMSSAGSNDYNSSSGRSERIKSKKIRRGPKPAYGRICSRFDKYYSYDMTPALQRHYDVCEKCHRAPSHILLERAKRSKKKRRRDDDELDPNDEEYLTRLGGWVRCLKCCTASHWRCLSAVRRSEIVKAVRARAETKDSLTNAAATRFKDLETDEATDFVCGSCSKGGICMICHEIAIKPETKEKEIAPSDNTITKMEVDGELDKGLEIQESGSGEGSTELLFRCFRCKRLAHYHHLTKPDEDSATVAEVADHYQEVNKWECRDCVSYTLPVDKIIAWRPYPADAKDEYMDQLSLPKYRENLPREYLIKWKTRSYRRPTWVPHMWLLSTHMARLKNFYEMGPRIQLSDNQDDNKERTINDEHALMTEGSSREASLEASQMVPEGPPTSMPDAETRIPKMWKTVERILDVRIWTPLKDDQSNIGFSNGNLPADIQKEFDNAFELGIEPSGDFDEGINEFEKRTGRKLQDNDADKIVWAFIKWDDLPYDEATWDSPPRPGELGYHEYCRAFKSFLFARTVTVERRSSSFYKTLDESGGRFASKLKIPSDGMYDIGQDEKSKLMPFQIEGVNWLSYNWAKKYSSILADEMGLGKTVQIITFLGLLHSKLDLYPFLIVVPNSTISNWVREFSRWAPNLRVVPFYGEAESRKIIMKYELHHEKAAPGTTGAKYHVLVTTYETVTGKNDFHTVFKKNPRWELLIVDEGQRLKSDTNMIFKRLSELNSGIRILMTGTPLNNNIRELFSLLNFLDPSTWDDVDALESEYEVLDEERVKKLHEVMRPYFLRRVKADVLSLPPKNEVIVPVSLAPLQKEIYKSIISKNVDLLRSLTINPSARVNKSHAKRSNMRNILMELRKCTQHPYLVHEDIEPKNLSVEETHSKMIDASSKLRLLKMLLPKLKAKGHRVLLFSQFKLALNIVEDFLQGEGYKFLRLDGDTKQADRQKSVDTFNHDNSDVFIFILTTRAGGVGINLWSADTVILFDPDFNPHQDLQAIARAHRYGQTKRCLVFKLMTKDTVEEKIMQVGKKKLVLDHLIVQKIHEDDTEDLKSLLTFGAKALFEENNEDRDINYTENDIDDLINKIETEVVEEENNEAFSFARVWSTHKETLDDLIEAENAEETEDSWAQTLKKIAEKRSQLEVKEREKMGRGARRKTAGIKNYYIGDSPEKSPKAKKRRHHDDSSGDEYSRPQSVASEATSASEAILGEDLDLVAHPPAPKGPAQTDSDPFTWQGHSNTALPQLDPPSRYLNGLAELCSLCSTVHKPGQCPQSENAVNLASYRRILVFSIDLSYTERSLAISLIDEQLERLGCTHLTLDQPRKPIKKASIANNNHADVPDSTSVSG